VDDQGWAFEGGSLEVDEEAVIDEERRLHWG